MSASTQASPESRQSEREQIAEQVAEFIANGGEIEIHAAPEGYCDSPTRLDVTDVKY